AADHGHQPFEERGVAQDGDALANGGVEVDRRAFADHFGGDVLQREQLLILGLGRRIRLEKDEPDPRIPAGKAEDRPATFPVPEVVSLVRQEFLQELALSCGFIFSNWSRMTCVYRLRSS